MKLREFFGSKRLSSLTTKDGNDYLRWLSSNETYGGAGLSASTPAKHLDIAKGILREAVDAGILPLNPFQRLRSEKPINRARQLFIAPELIQRVIDAVANPELRTVITLSRWGGLRIPSEAFALQWKHVDWNSQRLNVPTVKTKARAVPLFPEVSRSLTELWQELPSPSVEDFVVPLLRTFSDSNLRKIMTVAVRSAGLAIWPKIFHNLRASRQTELEERFPRKTVCEWMGNSETVADHHYLQVLQEHFDRAVISESQTLFLPHDAVANLLPISTHSLPKSTLFRL